MMRIEISVIMPVYNMVEYVGDAIESILNQTFSKFELIIIDDASTDGTDRVLYSYVDYRIMIERNERNIGNYASRNKGIQKARGKYIAIMDADDIAIPTRLEKQISYLKIHPNVLAIGSDCIYIPINQKKSRAFTYLDIQIALLENNCFVHSSLMIRADILRQLHGYDEYYYYSSDYDLACRLVLLGEVENLSDPLILYRWHASQITTLHGEEQKKYADEIRRKYQQAFINRYKKLNQMSVKETALGYPEMGRVICLYTYASYTGFSEYEQLADTLLNWIFEEISEEMPVCIDNGLLGIGCGLVYLIRNGLVRGEEDEVLSEIDAFLFKELSRWRTEEIIDWYGWIHYFRIRMLCPVRLVNQQMHKIIWNQQYRYLLDCFKSVLQKGAFIDKQMMEELKFAKENGFI